MKLSLKQKAFTQTLTLVGSALITGVVVALIAEYVAFSTILIFAGIGFVAYMFYLVYQINLSQLQYKEKLQEMVDKK